MIRSTSHKRASPQQSRKVRNNETNHFIANAPQAIVIEVAKVARSPVSVSATKVTG
jgi:hypothetical protein